MVRNFGRNNSLKEASSGWVQDRVETFKKLDGQKKGLKNHKNHINSFKRILAISTNINLKPYYHLIFYYSV